MGVHWKIRFLGGGEGASRKTINRRDCLKKEGLGQFADLRGGLSKKEGVVFLWGERVDTSMHTMSECFLRFLMLVEGKKDYFCCRPKSRTHNPLGPVWIFLSHFVPLVGLYQKRRVFRMFLGRGCSKRKGKFP